MYSTLNLRADKLPTFQLLDDLDGLIRQPSPKTPTTLHASTAASCSPPAFTHFTFCAHMYLVIYCRFALSMRHFTTVKVLQ